MNPEYVKSRDTRLPGDVPHVTRAVDGQHPVVDGDVMKFRGSLFVPEVRVGNPDDVPVAVLEPDARLLLPDFRKCEPRIAPLLPEVHAHRIILRKVQYNFDITNSGTANPQL